MADELGLFGEEIPATPAPVVEAPPAPAPAAEPAPVEAPKGEVKDASPASERPRDENGRFKPREDDEPMVPLKAMLSERDRRQAAEKERDDAKANAPKADIWADPDAYVKAKIEEMKPALVGEAEVKAAERFFWYTVDAATNRHVNDDVKYEQANAAFTEIAQKDPLMIQKLQQARDPGEFIYQQGKRAMELKEVGGDLSAYRTRIETEARAKWEKEAEERAKRNAGIPVSLNSEPSKGAGVTGNAAWAGPTPDEQVFPQR